MADLYLTISEGVSVGVDRKEALAADEVGQWRALDSHPTNPRGVGVMGWHGSDWDEIMQRPDVPLTRGQREILERVNIAVLSRERLAAMAGRLLIEVRTLQRQRDDFEQRLHAYKSGEIA